MLETADRARPSEVVCTECGRGTPGHKPVRPWWPRAVLFGLPLVALTLFVWYASSRIGATPIGGAAIIYPELVRPGYTRADLERLAAEGPAPGFALTRAIYHQLKPSAIGSGDARYQVAVFGSGDGVERRTLALGWPYAWLSVTRARFYDNVAKREGYRPAMTRVRASTYQEHAANIQHEKVRPEGIQFREWWLTLEIGAGRTGGVMTDARVYVPALVTMVVLSAIVVVVLRRLMRRAPAWVFWLLVAAVVGAWSAPQRSMNTVVTSWGPSGINRIPGIHTAVGTGYVLTTLTRSALRDMLDDPEADRTVARLILAESAQSVRASPQDRLFAGACVENWNSPTCEFRQIAAGTPIVQLWSLVRERCPDFGVQEVVTPPRDSRWTIGRDVVTFEAASGREGEPQFMLEVRLPLLIMVLTFILGPGVVPVAVYRSFIRRRVARRERERKCVECGYPLATTAGVS